MNNTIYLRIEVLLLFVESLLYGAFCVLYLMSLWILVCRQRRSERSAALWMAGVLTAMFVLAGTVRTSSSPTIRDTTQMAQHGLDPVILIVMTFLGDGFMTYRIFVVWDRNLVSLVLPGILLVGDLIAAAYLGDGLLWYENPKDFNSLLVPALHARFIAYFAVTLLTNLVMTLLLLGRLWWHDRRAKRYQRHAPHGPSVHWHVMHTILHSVAAYSLGLVLNLAACAARSQLVLLTSCVLPPLIGISFALIIMRIGLSEVLTDGGEKGAGEAVSDPARALACIAVNVHISRTVDMMDMASEQGTTCDDKTASACHGDSEDVSMVEAV